MPRDLLLYFLAALVLVNFAMLLAVAIVRYTDIRDREARRFDQQAGPSGGAKPAAQERGPLPRAATAPMTRTAWDGPGSPAPASVLAPGPASVPAPGAASAAAGPPEPRAPVGSTSSMRRPRRFVMPRLEEDRDRAERAIQAVLGETSIAARAGELATHRPRRRSRRHRTAGTTPHTAVDLSLRGLEALRTAVGAEAVGRLTGAVVSTVQAHVRSGDRTIDLGEGRLRVIVEADPPGAAAAAERIRGLTADWLAASVVPVTLRTTVAAPVEPVVPADVAAS